MLPSRFYTALPGYQDASMPELPEVEMVRRTLAPAVVGHVIEEVRVGSFTGVIGDMPPAMFSAATVGQTIAGIGRRGKYLVIHLSDDTAIIVHLRMTGQLLVHQAADPPARFQHLAVGLDGGAEIRFADQRKFGRVLHVSTELVDRLDRRLGPEPLAASFTARRLAASLSRRPGKIKNVLLDQTVVAGLGNIYVDEALFRARLHPLRSAQLLSMPEVQTLHRAIRSVLRQGLTHRGTTFSSYRDANGEGGGNQRHLSVYGRGGRGEPCDACGAPLERLVVGGRGTHICPNCQTLADK